MQSHTNSRSLSLSTTEPECWQTGLASQDAQQRTRAAENLSYLGEEAAFAAVELVKACAEEGDTRDWAVAALETMGRPLVDSKQRLSELCVSPNPLVAYWAVTLLGRLGPDAKSEQDQLIGLIQSASTELSVRERAVWALGQMGAVACKAIPVLIGLRDAKNQPRLAGLAERSLTQIET
jgi:HEAT repeat protein